MKAGEICDEGDTAGTVGESGIGGGACGGSTLLAKLVAVNSSPNPVSFVITT